MVKRQAGGNFKAFINKAGAALKTTGLVGKAAAALAPVVGKAASGVLGAEAGSAISSLGTAGANALKSKGWGKKRRHHGGALKLAGRGPARIVATGSRRMVWNGSAKHTSGGLTKDKLMLNARGRIVSIAKHNFGKSKGFDYLKKAGYEPKKGEFKLFSKKS